MGEDRPGPGAQVGVRPLKAPPARLYGRGRGHGLGPRQRVLLAETLPRIAFRAEQAADPIAAFAPDCRVLWLEVGFGGGEHALAQSAAHPTTGLIACEVFENGICSLLSRLVPQGGESEAPLPGNLRVWAGDARVLLGLLPDCSLDRLFLLFPDPWPKARHAKRRFVHPGLLPVVARVLQRGAEWRTASDDPSYQRWIGEVMATQDLFEAPPPLAIRPDDWPPTRYEAKALREGRAPLYWAFTRR